MKNLLLLVLLIIGGIQSYSQNKQDSIRQNSAEWRYKQKYNHLIQNNLFTKGMSDDEMAGILLYKGGNNLKVSFACEVFGAMSSSLMLTITNKEAQTAITLLAVASAIFYLTGIVELISGYNKISKAGIIFQHKGYNIKTSGTGISLNF